MQAAQQTRQLRITLLQERSAGTFARVYLAEATGDGGISRIVAVKVLKEQWAGSEELLDRTQDEARLLARLHHKNILRVEALAEIDGQPAIVMEFVDGVDLKQLIESLAASGSRIPARAAYRIALCAASALDAAYSRAPYGRGEALRVVHRDLKPSNVMVSVEGEVKVLDFGTARFTDEARIAKTGVLRFGSMKYMSPERRLGDRGEHPSDIYALGLLLLEMLRGEQLPLLPLDREEHDEALREIIDRLPELGLPNAEWEGSLRQTLQRMIHHDPSGRLEAKQVMELLRAFADHADGPSLDSWSADTVARVTRQVYGDGIDGALSGSQVFVRLSAGGTGVGSEVVAQRVDSSGPRHVPDPAQAAGGHPDPVITRNGPTAGRASGRGTPPGGNLLGGSPILGAPHALADEPTMLQMDADRTEPEVEAQNWQPTPLPAPQPQATPAIQPGLADAGPTRTAPKAAAAPAGNKKMMMLALAGGLLVGFLLLAGLGLAGGLYYYLSGSKDLPVAGADDGPTAEAPVPDAPAAGAKLDLQLSTSDPTIQWLKLEDEAGGRLAKAAPSASAAVAPGAYALSGKVVGRGTVQAQIVVSADSSWSCAAADAGAIRCDDAVGGASVLLKP